MLNIPPPVCFESIVIGSLEDDNGNINSSEHGVPDVGSPRYGTTNDATSEGRDEDVKIETTAMQDESLNTMADDDEARDALRHAILPRLYLIVHKLLFCDSVECLSKFYNMLQTFETQELSKQELVMEE